MSPDNENKYIYIYNTFIKTFINNDQPNSMFPNLVGAEVVNSDIRIMVSLVLTIKSWFGDLVYGTR